MMKTIKSSKNIALLCIVVLVFAQLAAFFNERGFAKVYSMIGGYTQWQSELRAE